MLYAVIGILKQPAPPRDAAFEAALNEHLAQPHVRVVSAGYLRDREGQPSGVLALVDVDTPERAKAYLEASPFHRGGQFEQMHVAEYDVEVGQIH